ncbi:hypothetical protein [Phaeocystidibacter luteus]|uniref:Outer membrane beta-barrel protein n=1 Tax=Phaeocystidibacter luteus TaxID=911197 RepID=A0A6N6RFT3_9FLAO|nr:hypothetical protein [Phaeocystidibacter luteus]KAB2808608.1 hypothetical protein F8C67_09990 [Phaeocystidibacter luteus]
MYKAFLLSIFTGLSFVSQAQNAFGVNFMAGPGYFTNSYTTDDGPTPINYRGRLYLDLEVSKESPTKRFFRIELGLGRHAITDRWETTTPDMPDGTGEFADVYYYFNSVYTGLKFRQELNAVKHLSIGVGAGYHSIRSFRIYSPNIMDRTVTDISYSAVEVSGSVQYEVPITKRISFVPSLEGQVAWQFDGLGDNAPLDAMIAGIYLGVGFQYSWE